MIRTKTVFIVGAGASHEVGLPLGVDLTKQIAEALDFNDRSSGLPKELVRGAVQNLTQHSQGQLRGRFQEICRKAADIAEALQMDVTPSIDAFIDNHSHDPDIATLGKLAIAACLIEAERKSKLAAKPGARIKLAAAEKVWLRPFFHIVAEGVKATNLEAIFENVTFIVFNYDRCIEQFLEQAISGRFFVDIQRAREIVRKHCRIVHPYGSLARLGAGTVGMEFGTRLIEAAHHSSDAVIGMAENLRTFTEANTGKESEVIDGFLQEADRAIFLGSAFHRQNMQLLTTTNSSVKEYRATVYGLSESNQREVRLALRDVFRGAAPTGDFYNDTCATLVSAEYQYLTR
jgi:hypothetical protein